MGIPFGRVTNVLVLKGKNQAFIEMADEISATSMVSCYTVNPPQMRGRMVYVQFSNHRELKTDQTHNVSETHLFIYICISYIYIYVCVYLYFSLSIFKLAGLKCY